MTGTADSTRSAVWITGGTRGLGRSVSVALAPQASVALTYRDDDRSAQQTRATLVRATGREPLLLRGDLSRDGVAESHVREILAAFGRLDHVVHCAALASFKPLLMTRPRELRRVMEYSFEAFHRVVLASVEPVTAGKGSLVAVSSAGARRAIPHYGAMGAAKGALESYARHLAAELGPRGVRVNVVSPGTLKTASLARLGVGPDDLAAVAARTPLQRLPTTEEVAATIRFMLSDAAAAITGQTITVDGGYDVQG